MRFIKKLLVAVITGSILIKGFTVQALDLQKDSFLLYLDKFYDSERTKNVKSNVTNNFSDGCIERKITWTVYYRMVYFKICENLKKLSSKNVSKNLTDIPSNDFDKVCNQLSSYYENNTDNRQIDETLRKHNIYKLGLASNQRQLAFDSCKYIKDYYEQKELLNINNSKNLSEGFPRYPKYTEWLIHTLPFALPITCGFTKQAYDSYSGRLSIDECLPTSYKWCIYITMFIDSVIVLAVVFSNLLILVVTWKTPAKYTAHRYFRVSLALADLIIGIVVCGTIYTTHTLYFGPHKFTENGHKASVLDYLTQSYIDGQGAITVLSLTASVLTLVAISADRFIAIYQPLSYKLHTHKVKKFSVITLSILWLFSLFIAACPLFFSDITYSVTALGVIIAPKFYIAYILCLGIPLLCIWFLNIKMTMLMKQHKKKFVSSMNVYAYDNRDFTIATEEENTTFSAKVKSNLATVGREMRIKSTSSCTSIQSTSKSCVEKDTEISLALTVRVVVVAFTIAIIPGIIVMLTGLSSSLEPDSNNFNPQAKATWNSFAYISSRVLFSNSFFNCIIYSHRCKDFRRITRRLLSFSIFKRFKRRENGFRKWTLRSKVNKTESSLSI